MTNKEIPKIPILPYGEGSITWVEQRQQLMYKKNIMGKRKAVYGKTVNEVLKKMKQIEREILQATKGESKINITELLDVSIKRWLLTFKANELKNRSLDRLEHTINNQILKYDIGKREVKSIDDMMIQEHLNKLIEENYSYSTLKKTYEAFNQFFNYIYAREPYHNPMLTVIKPTKDSMNVEEKDIDFFDDRDIKLFVREATSKNSKGNFIYRIGYGLIFIMYSGIRVSEALALRWEDIDFENNCFYVTGNFAKIIDRKAKPKDDGTRTYKIEYTSTKTKAGKRKVILTKNAKEALFKLKEIQKYNSDLDFVLATESGKTNLDGNLRRTLNRIQSRAKMSVQNSGLHVLRHTFVSLLVRNGVDKVVIASMIGQSDTSMIEKIYQHITEEEVINAVNLVNDISQLDL